jgi:hypothetical protein
MRLKITTIGGLMLATVLGGVGVSASAQQADDHGHMRHGHDAEQDARPARNTVVEDIPLADGAFQRVWYAQARGASKGTVVMFPGGAGTIGIEKDGTIAHADNFLVRTRDSWLQRGYGVVLVDAIGQRSLRGERSTAAYADVTRKIVRFAQEQGSGPVWLIGTSQGSIAAMNGAAHQTEGGIAGVILTESVSIPGKRSQETVFDAHPQAVTVPALIVANQEDRCDVALPSEADAIARSLSHARVTVLRVTSGLTRSREACSSLSPHGYYGIENQVVDEVTHWMQTDRVSARIDG